MIKWKWHYQLVASVEAGNIELPQHFRSVESNDPNTLPNQLRDSIAEIQADILYREENGTHG